MNSQQDCLSKGRLNLSIHSSNRDMVTLADVEEKSIRQHHADWQRIFLIIFFFKNMSLKHRDKKLCGEKVCLSWSLRLKKINRAILVFS